MQDDLRKDNQGRKKPWTTKERAIISMSSPTNPCKVHIKCGPSKEELAFVVPNGCMLHGRGDFWIKNE